MDHAQRAPWLDPAEEAGRVHAAQRGDRAAFLALARAYQRSVHRIAYALTRSPADARQLTLETLIRAWRGIQHLPEGQRFHPWVTRIARNLCASHRRRSESPGPAPTAEGTGGELERAFERLGAEHQYALVLRVVEGLSYAEIARAFDQPPSAALSRVATARAALRTALQRRGREDARAA